MEHSASSSAPKDHAALLARIRDLEAESEQLRSQVASLQQRGLSLEQERDRERQDWARFKAWFTESVARKQRKRAAEMQQQQQPALDTTPVASSRKKRKLLSQADEAILREVGIDEAIVKGLKGELDPSSPMLVPADIHAAEDVTPKPKLKTRRGQPQASPARTTSGRSVPRRSTPSTSQTPLQLKSAPSQPRGKTASPAPESPKPPPATTRRPRAPSPSSSEFESAGAEALVPAKSDERASKAHDEGHHHAQGSSPEPSPPQPRPSSPESDAHPKASNSRTPKAQARVVVAAASSAQAAASSVQAAASSPALTREEILAKRRQEMEEMKRNPNKHKGKGRYAKEIPSDGQASTSLNALYEIVPEMNNGVAFAHNEVVRDRATRKKMHAFDCACCRDWYEAVGGDEPAVFIRPLPTSKEEEEAEAAERKERRMQELRQNASRHRAFGPPPATPPSYWTIGFPTTQEAEEIRRKAEEADEEKRRQMERDPRYRRRKE